MNDPRIQIVVLDDDPTGIQTVHGCLFLTRWNEETLKGAFRDSCPFFYVLTNTRAYNREKACKIISSIVENVLKVNREFGSSLIFISRSDSTLRSHFPAEINEIIRVAGREDSRPIDAVFFIPAFFEGGRITSGNTHFVLEGDRRIPASETEFAKDSVFGYHTSYLPAYIEEKTDGAVSSKSVESVSLELLRDSRIQTLHEFLHKLQDRRYVVVNAENYSDLNRFAGALLAEVERGKHFVFQSAASLVKSLSGIPDKPLVGGEIVKNRGPGLIVAGSYVRKTTAQLKTLLACDRTQGIEIDVLSIIDSQDKILGRTLDRVRQIRSNNKTPVVYTSRKELQFASKRERLAAGENISHFLVRLVRRMPISLSYLLAKGGITSHDILVHGLRIATARVLGQILPGVPVIAVPENSRFMRGMPYVIFPGNVGDDHALLQVFQILNAGEK
jgi:uncharacterized protein YgbK (DUF1537 family)